MKKLIATPVATLMLAGVVWQNKLDLLVWALPRRRKTGRGFNGLNR